MGSQNNRITKSSRIEELWRSGIFLLGWTIHSKITKIKINNEGSRRGINDQGGRRKEAQQNTIGVRNIGGYLWWMTIIL